MLAKNKHSSLKLFLVQAREPTITEYIRPTRVHFCTAMKGYPTLVEFAMLILYFYRTKSQAGLRFMLQVNKIDSSGIYKH